MSKQKYYVSVQAGTILADQGASSYELEIEATETEVAKLQELFDELAQSSDATFIRNHIPSIPYHQDEENDSYDYWLKEIYNRLHQLGTEETRKHIEEMGILSKDFFAQT